MYIACAISHQLLLGIDVKESSEVELEGEICQAMRLCPPSSDSLMNCHFSVPRLGRKGDPLPPPWGWGRGEE